MNAISYLNEILINRSAFVPESLAVRIVQAAALLGITICGGMYDPETDTRVLYVA